MLKREISHSFAGKRLILGNNTRFCGCLEMAYFLVDLRTIYATISTMKHQHPSPVEMEMALRPWFSTFSDIVKRVEDDVLSVTALLGLARAQERAGDFHRGLRTKFRSWCDETNDLFVMVEERDGLGLDVVRCNLVIDKPFIIRTGRLNGSEIRRNGSNRQATARASGKLSSDLLFPELDDPSPRKMQQITLAYSIEDEGTRRGIPAWYVGRLALGVERFDGFDELAEIDSYSQPENFAEDVRRAVAVPNDEELALWRRQIRRAREAG